MGAKRLSPSPDKFGTVEVEICPECSEDMVEKMVKSGNYFRAALKKMSCPCCGYSYPILTPKEERAIDEVVDINEELEEGVV